MARYKRCKWLIKKLPCNKRLDGEWKSYCEYHSYKALNNAKNKNLYVREVIRKCKLNDCKEYVDVLSTDKMWCANHIPHYTHFCKCKTSYQPCLILRSIPYIH